ncbi:MAG: hypothetical protein RLZZ245_425 [Verrucomicrobiota bacterium]
MKIHYRRNRFLPLTAALALLVNHATAATFTWDGSTNTPNMVNANNWVGSTIPTFDATADLVFREAASGFTQANIMANRTVRSLTFNSFVTTDFSFMLQDTNDNATVENLTMGDATNSAAITVDSGAGNVLIGTGPGLRGSVILANNLAVAQNSTTGNLTIDRPITGAFALTKTGNGTLTLTNTNTYTGTTTIQNGTLALDGAANRLAVAGAVVLGGTGTTGKLVLGGTTPAGQTLTALTTTGSGGSVVGGNAALSALTLNIASSNTFDGTLGGAGTNENTLALTKQGVGTLTLSNTINTFTGQVLVDAGTIQVTKLANTGTASSTGAGTASIRLGNTATATLEYIGTTDSSTNRQIQVGNNAANTSGATILNNSASGKLTFTNANFIAQATAAATTARVLTLGGSYTGSANEIQGVIKDNTAAAVSLIKTGASTWQLSAANTSTGATTVSDGILQLNGSTHASSTVGIGTAGTLSGSGTVNGNATLTGGGIINKSAGSIAGTLGVTGGQWNGLGTVTGAVTSSSGNFTIGSGANLTSTAGVSATGGALVVNGTLTGILSTNSSTTVSGTGTITGNTTISGIHTPGNSPGIQSFGSNLSYANGSSVTWELGSNSLGLRGTDFDGINVGGTLDFSGATTLNMVFNFAGSAVDWTDTFWNTSRIGTSGWLVYDVAGSTTNFANLSINSANWLDGSGGDFNTSNSGNTFSLYQDGNDIYLNYTVVPEPNVAALLGGLGTLVLLRRRRYR